VHEHRQIGGQVGYVGDFRLLRELLQIAARLGGITGCEDENDED
jgi:hypothetical protein